MRSSINLDLSQVASGALFMTSHVYLLFQVSSGLVCNVAVDYFCAILRQGNAIADHFCVSQVLMHSLQNVWLLFSTFDSLVKNCFISFLLRFPRFVWYCIFKCTFDLPSFCYEVLPVF